MPNAAAGAVLEKDRISPEAEDLVVSNDIDDANIIDKLQTWVSALKLGHKRAQAAISEFDKLDRNAKLALRRTEEILRSKK